MELCSNSTKTLPSLHFKTLLPSPIAAFTSRYFSIPPHLQTPNTKYCRPLFISHKQSFQQHPSSKKNNSICFAAASSSSSSSPALDTINDPLPADLQVTEIEEPNSRVRLSVEVPPVVCEDCYKRVMNEFMKQAKGLLLFDDVGIPLSMQN